MTFQDQQLNSMTFQAWKIKFLNSMTFQVFHDLYEPCQRAKKVVPDSLGLVDFAGIQITRTVKSILLIKKLLGLVEMMSGLVNASFSLPKWQAVKMIFFAHCLLCYYVR